MLYVLYCIRTMHCCDRSCKYSGEWASYLATQHSGNSLYIANIHYLVMAAERCRRSIEVGVVGTCEALRFDSNSNRRSRFEFDSKVTCRLNFESAAHAVCRHTTNYAHSLFNKNINLCAVCSWDLCLQLHFTCSCTAVARAHTHAVAAGAIVQYCLRNQTNLHISAICNRNKAYFFKSLSYISKLSQY